MIWRNYATVTLYIQNTGALKMHDLKMQDINCRHARTLSMLLKMHDLKLLEFIRETCRNSTRRMSPADSRQGIDHQSSLSKYQNFATQRSWRPQSCCMIGLLQKQIIFVNARYTERVHEWVLQLIVRGLWCFKFLFKFCDVNSKSMIWPKKS